MAETQRPVRVLRQVATVSNNTRYQQLLLRDCRAGSYSNAPIQGDPAWGVQRTDVEFSITRAQEGIWHVDVSG
jgi:hypothetical protein